MAPFGSRTGTNNPHPQCQQIRYIIIKASDREALQQRATTSRNCFFADLSLAELIANIKKALSEVLPKFARWKHVTVGGVFSRLKLRNRTRQSNNMSDNGAMTALAEVLGR